MGCHRVMGVKNIMRYKEENMKILTIAICFCFISIFAFAGTSAEIISYDKDDNGNIRVWTQYKIDGVEVDSRYPKINGKQVYCTRYTVFNFVDMTDNEIVARVKEDIEKHAETLIIKTFTEKKNDIIVQNNLYKLVGTTATKITATKKISDTKEWVLKTDGTFTTNIITP